VIPALLVVFLLVSVGYATVRRVLWPRTVLAPMALVMGTGVGAGLFSLLCLLSLFLFGGVLPWVLLYSSILLALAVVFICVRGGIPATSLGDKTDLALFTLLLVLTALFSAYIHSNFPNGDWDAWSLWNFRASAIFRSEHGAWMNIFHNDVQGKHPWLLPLTVVWGWCLLGGEAYLFPILVAVLFTLATVGLLVWGLRQYVDRVPAVLAGFYYVTLPFVLWHSASQYADVLTGYFFLAVILCLGKVIQDGEAVYNRLFGVFMALLASSKDEGILLAAILFVLLLISSKHRKILNRDFWIFFLAFVWGTVVCEILMRTMVVKAPFISSVYYGTSLAQVFDLSRWQLVLAYFGVEGVLNRLWGALWLLFIAAMFAWPRRKRDAIEKIILRTVSAFCFFFFFLYLVTSTDLLWRLSVTMNRLLYQIVPVMTFYIFYRIFRRPGKAL
jgi:hypothetical protein